MMIKSIVIALLVATIVCQAVAEAENAKPWQIEEGGIKAQGNEYSNKWGDENDGGQVKKNQGTFSGVDAFGNPIKGAFSQEVKQVVKKSGENGGTVYYSSSSSSSSSSYSSSKK